MPGGILKTVLVRLMNWSRTVPGLFLGWLVAFEWQKRLWWTRPTFHVFNRFCDPLHRPNLSAKKTNNVLGVISWPRWHTFCSLIRTWLDYWGFNLCFGPLRVWLGLPIPSTLFWLNVFSGKVSCKTVTVGHDLFRLSKFRNRFRTVPVRFWNTRDFLDRFKTVPERFLSRTGTPPEWIWNRSLTVLLLN